MTNHDTFNLDDLINTDVDDIIRPDIKEINERLLEVIKKWNIN